MSPARALSENWQSGITLKRRQQLELFLAILPNDETSIDLMSARLGIQEVTAALRSISLFDDMDTSSVLILYQVCHHNGGSMFKSERKTKEDMVRFCEG